MSIDELLLEVREAVGQSWFIHSFDVMDRTNVTVTIHLPLASNLFVQIFLSERSGRFNLALIGPAGRLYGRDREYGVWHQHPFEHPDRHEPTPAGMSPRPVHQFLAEVEQILLENDLI